MAKPSVHVQAPARANHHNQSSAHHDGHPHQPKVVIQKSPQQVANHANYLGSYKTINQLTRPHKSAFKSVRFAPKSINSSVVSSPPMQQIKSKYSRSRRFDPHEVGPVTPLDYLLLLIYYICLYLFYAAFWYALWSIYMATTNPKAPRVDHRSFDSRSRFNDTMFEQVDDIDSAGHLQRGVLKVNKTQLWMSLTEEQRFALSFLKCNDTLKLAKDVVVPQSNKG